MDSLFPPIKVTRFPDNPGGRFVAVLVRSITTFLFFWWFMACLCNNSLRAALCCCCGYGIRRCPERYQYTEIIDPRNGRTVVYRDTVSYFPGGRHAALSIVAATAKMLATLTVVNDAVPYWYWNATVRCSRRVEDHRPASCNSHN